MFCRYILHPLKAKSFCRDRWQW